ncbi:ligase-associated DNA damage response endonuclease PdeM [uncultured Sphingosinicella sp.]|uniref:ligase-associated DNA damage response endonuclease PdeM n=1 Tax=uncultured Sphingosinicella sp. TaxID=478748 RepID=UPI0030DD13D6|tara:strand:+ start:5167 stop:5823 length:657 start_codon:yes stop_codon:yes gene_type:complete
MVPLSFAGHEMVPLAAGALWWPARRGLLVADLHFEKASWFARFGQMLPPYDSLQTLSDLDALITATGAATLWCLGDSFHDADGPGRLGSKARDLLCALQGRVDWVWITGNHDLKADGIGEVRAEVEVDGIMLRHEAEPGSALPEISGHFHPKIRVHGRGRMVSRRCFVMSQRKLILPAFGALTGGLAADHPAILSAAGGPATALVPTKDRLLRFPLAA